MTGSLIEEMQIALEKDLRSQVDKVNEAKTLEYYNMMTYHMGWTGEGTGLNSTGKRIRPLFLLLCAASGSLGYSWQSALPAASAVELIHNFSLIHDDIQDNSDTRRNRPTLWRKWGVPQAINAGDGLYALSNLASIDLLSNNLHLNVIRVAEILHKTCLKLTRGQFLDMSFEKEKVVSLEDYWTMIANKTAALLSASTEIGAILASQSDLDTYRQFGHFLGLAFQIKDDLLGIWGTKSQTGKSTVSDLVSGKKTLPVLYGIQKGGSFSKLWFRGNIIAEEVSDAADLLAKEGAKQYAEEMADQMTGYAKNFLAIISPKGPAGEALYDLTIGLLNREA
jgi:geranylgeranyl diphosphate synthase type I